MRLITFTAEGGEDHVGALLDDNTVLDLTDSAPQRTWSTSMLALVDAGPEALAEAEGLVDTARSSRSGMEVRPCAGLDMRAPIPRPLKNVFCVGLNFRSHVEQNALALGEEPQIPETPLFFSKPTTAVTGPGSPIHFDPRLTSKLDYEVELALVIGKSGTWIPVDEAGTHIFGYTILNDVSARDLQWRSSQFLYGKGQDTYAPLGPVITTADEMPPWDQVESQLWVNDELRQRESLAHMIFDPEHVVAELSKGITLEPGDIVSLGTPGGCGYQMSPPVFLSEGDVVECRIDGIGSLVNPVRAVVDASPGRDNKPRSEKEKM